MLDIRDYQPGRFAYLMREPFARQLWDYLSAEERVAEMRAAADAGKPAIEPLLAEIESKFNAPLASPDYPTEEVEVFINTMIRHILEQKGYELIACGLCRSGRYIKSSGLFAKTAAE